MLNVTTNDSKVFTDTRYGVLSINVEVFDPRKESGENLLVLESQFNNWVMETPMFWYKNIPSFQTWIDEVWTWINENKGVVND